MQHALAMHVVELEALHGVPFTSAACGGESRSSVPHTTEPREVSTAVSVRRRMRLHSRLRAEQRAAERIQHQQLDARLVTSSRNLLVAETATNSASPRV